MLQSSKAGADMQLLPRVCFCFLTLSGLTFGDRSGSLVTTVTVKEDDDVILPCSLGTSENIESMLFDWKKEGTVPRKEVFMYDPDSPNIFFRGQDEQFKGRVSHFPGELKQGNASIRITKVRLEDKGNYICIFPRTQPSQKEFTIKLVVGAAPQPSVTNLDQTNDWALLQCDVQGAHPKPTVEWWDSDSQIIPSEEPQVSERGECFYITLNTTVKKSGRYRCVATQKEIYHQTSKQINVYLNGAAPEPYVTILKDKGQLQCKVPGASPKPTVKWWDSDNKTLPSKTVQDREEKGRFYIIIHTTVSKPGCYHCVATQMEEWHRISSEICVHDDSTGWKIPFIVLLVVLVVVVLVAGILLWRFKKNKKKKQFQKILSDFKYQHDQNQHTGTSLNQGTETNQDE